PHNRSCFAVNRPSHLLSDPPYSVRLHSFPTRRSSDLIDLDFEIEIFGSYARLPLAISTIAEAMCASDDFIYVAARDRVYKAKTTDRKSTRLNSSHASISYAVFCLNKKNGRIMHLSSAI